MRFSFSSSRTQLYYVHISVHYNDHKNHLTVQKRSAGAEEVLLFFIFPFTLLTHTHTHTYIISN